jgi:hypothetical protein
MRLALTSLVLSAVWLGVFRAEAAPTSQALGPDACARLKAAIRSEFGLPVSALHFTPTGPFNCSASRGSPGSPGYRLFTFGYLPPAASGSPAAAHKFWQSQWNQWRGKSGKDFTAERLRGFGADDAFGIEKRYQDPALHTDTNITWVKGAYEGGIELAGPGHSGDLEDAQDLLKALMKGIPRA